MHQRFEHRFKKKREKIAASSQRRKRIKEAIDRHIGQVTASNSRATKTIYVNAHKSSATGASVT